MVEKMNSVSFFSGQNADRISLLPDDILIAILSFLTVKESVCSSVLARRWVNLWKHTTCLNFEKSQKLLKVPSLQPQTSRFIKGVTQVLKLHQSLTIQHLRVCLDFDVSELPDYNVESLDQWVINFAISKKVQILELDFSKADISYYRPFGHNWKRYNPSQFVDCRFPSFVSLRVLSLANVPGQCIEYFLHNCPFLERLTVDNTKYSESLRVLGPSLPLEYLKIGRDCRFGFIEISNLTGLTTLIYHGEVHKLSVKNVPALANLLMDDRSRLGPDCSISCYPFIDYYNLVSCCFTRLEVLEIVLDCRTVVDVDKIGFPELRNLKELHLRNPCSRPEGSLLGYTYLVEQSPYLKKFVLHMGRSVTEVDLNEAKRKRKRVEFAHQNIEVVELRNYCGINIDLELVAYFVENTVSLKKIVVEPHGNFGFTGIFIDGRAKYDRKSRYEQLKGIVPASIQLSFIDH